MIFFKIKLIHLIFTQNNYTLIFKTKKKKKKKKKKIVKSFSCNSFILILSGETILLVLSHLNKDLE